VPSVVKIPLVYDVALLPVTVNLCIAGSCGCQLNVVHLSGDKYRLYGGFYKELLCRNKAMLSANVRMAAGGTETVKPVRNTTERTGPVLTAGKTGIPRKAGI